LSYLSPLSKLRRRTKKRVKLAHTCTLNREWIEFIHSDSTSFHKIHSIRIETNNLSTDSKEENVHTQPNQSLISLRRRRSSW